MKNPFGIKEYKRLPKDWRSRGKLVVAEYVLHRYVMMDDNQFNRQCFKDFHSVDKFKFEILN